MTYGNRFGGMLAGLAALLVVGCGGGGSNNMTAGIDRGGVTIAVGPVTGFGSIFVNGVEYATGGATFTVNGQPGTETSLHVGQVVRVEGTVNADGRTGTATKVVFSNNVTGPVQSIDLAAGRLVVLGQTIQVGASTSFGDGIVPRGLDGLAVGVGVEVSGLVTNSGTINATRIELQPSGATVELQGSVTGVDTGTKRFSINQQSVDYSAAQLDGFAGAQPANGDLVAAEGAVDGSGVLIATLVEKKSYSLEGTGSDKADLEGLITRFASSTDFDVAGQRVTTSSSTQYSGGTAANLALDASVQVEGSFDSTGRIVATKIEFRSEGDLEIFAQVQSVNVAGDSFVVLGETIRTNAQTRFEDHSAAQVERFSLANLNVGDFVQVRAYDDGNGLLATVLERDDPQGSVDLTGPATALAQPDFTVAGVLVSTDANTEFRDKDGVTITADTFFATAAGRTVEVSGTLVGNAVLATRAELDD